MKKKGALELSMNSIVIIILAVIFVSLVITFITNIFETQTAQTQGIISSIPDTILKRLTEDGGIGFQDQTPQVKAGGEFRNALFYKNNENSKLNCQITDIPSNANVELVRPGSSVTFDIGKAQGIPFYIKGKSGATAGKIESHFITLCCDSTLTTLIAADNVSCVPNVDVTISENLRIEVIK